MARIRSIHPGLLTDEAYMALTVEQPLAIALYLGLLMESDDFGVFEWKPMTIKARVLPAISADVASLLQALVDHRFISAFEVAGRKLGAIRNFCRYQRPKKPNAVHPRNQFVEAWVRTGDKLPDSATGSEPVPNQSSTFGEKSPQMEDGGGRMEDGGDEEAAAATQASRRSPSKLELTCRKIVEAEPVLLAQDFHVLEDLIEPGGICESDILVGVQEAIEKRADPKKRYRSWTSFVGWCRTAAQNRLAAAPRGKTQMPFARGDPEGLRVDFGGGVSAPHASIRKVIDRGGWLDIWGPKPGDPGCRVSADLLAEIMGRVDA